MMETLKSVIKDICTVKNGLDYDMAGVFGLIAVLVSCFMALYGLMVVPIAALTLPALGEMLKDFGFGTAAIIAAACGGKAWKKNAEPE